MPNPTTIASVDKPEFKRIAVYAISCFKAFQKALKQDSKALAILAGLKIA